MNDTPPSPVENQDPKPLTAHFLSFPVVGIGASAGGLEAFSKVFSALPVDTGMAFVVIQHLDPSHESQLAELLAKTTAMPVKIATESAPVEPNCVYVIPHAAEMTILSGRLHLSSRNQTEHHPFLPINRFFESLAQECKQRAIGVLLSGTGSDGCLGLQEIKAFGGVTFAQNEESAKFSGMPLNAIKSGAADFVSPPSQIALELTRISKHNYLENPDAENLNSIPQAYKEIIDLLRNHTGVDFSDYRDNSIRRRISRRLLLCNIHSLAEYARYLKKDRAEIETLYRDILINVTCFFRDPNVFEALKTTVFPEIIKNKSPESPIRIWVPGCSTGQEVYSIAIALLEFLDTEPMRPPIQIFGTDLCDARSIERARAGLYPESIAAEVSPLRLSRFFSREEEGFRVGRVIRDICIFAKQNVAVDPPFSRMDLISCRNLLIYLSATLQRRVIPAFHYALNPNGFLLLGSSETVGRFTDLFQVVDSKNKIHAKIATVTRAYPHFNAASASPVPPHPMPIQERQPNVLDLQKEADRLLLNRYAPAGVLINEDMEVLQFRGRTGAYLEPAQGEASFNLLRMARENLFSPIRAAIDEARQQARPIRKFGIRFRDGNQINELNLEVIPVKLPSSNHGGFLILFEPLRDETGNLVAPQPAQAQPVLPVEQGELDQLRQDLANAKEYLQSIIEQQAAANEELRSANEEVLSANEELQSTNEELQTSKEELQSTIEETTTVNEELQNRNQELARANDDLLNLLSSVKIPIVIFGTDLRIRRFTPAAGKTLGLIPADIGRSISNIRVPLNVPHLENFVTEFITNVVIHEQEVHDLSGHWYLLRIHPYRTSDNRIDGAVAVLMDIDEIRSSAQKLQQAGDYAMAIVDTTNQPLLILSHELKIVTGNRAFYSAFKLSENDCIGHSFFEISRGQCDIPQLRSILSEIASKGGTYQDIQIEHDFPHLGHRIMLLNVRQTTDSGRGTQILLAFNDITEHRMAESRNLAHLNKISAANAAKDRFLATLSHELRTPLTPVLLSVSTLSQREDLPEELRDDLQMIRRNIELEAQLIDDLLDLTAATQGKLALDSEIISAKEILKQAVQIVTPTAKAKNIELSITETAEFFNIKGDPTRMKQVFWNLLSNAIKFTEPGGRIQIHLTNIPGDKLRIEIKDSGMGIEADMLPFIFNAFEQGSPKITQRFGGLGLGLAIVKAITESHGGKIWAESLGENQGTRFILELPILPDLDPLRKAPLKTAPAAPRLTRTLRILIVEDHTDTARVLSNLLKRAGYVVAMASSFTAAQKLAADQTFDILVSDIGLPDGNGMDLMRYIREKQPVVGIAITGYGTKEDSAKIFLAGFSEVLLKPVSFELLQQAIVRLVPH